MANLDPHFLSPKKKEKKKNAKNIFSMIISYLLVWRCLNSCSCPTSSRRGDTQRDTKGRKHDKAKKHYAKINAVSRRDSLMRFPYTTAAIDCPIGSLDYTLNTFQTIDFSRYVS